MTSIGVDPDFCNDVRGGVLERDPLLHIEVLAAELAFVASAIKHAVLRIRETENDLELRRLGPYLDAIQAELMSPDPAIRKAAGAKVRQAQKACTAVFAEAERRLEQFRRFTRSESRATPVPPRRRSSVRRSPRRHRVARHAIHRTSGSRGDPYPEPPPAQKRPKPPRPGAFDSGQAEQLLAEARPPLQGRRAS